MSLALHCSVLDLLKLGKFLMSIFRRKGCLKSTQCQSLFLRKIKKQVIYHLRKTLREKKALEANPGNEGVNQPSHSQCDQNLL